MLPAAAPLLERLDAWLAQWWWARPFLMCLIVTGILGYLGTHVLARKVIFVDLATAQIAALGAAYATILGYEAGHDEDAVPIYLFSLGFALAGAAVIALTRMKKERVPHEAFIGIVYASASALAILVLSKSPTEGEQIKSMLVGSLQTVRLPRILATGLICAGVGAFHWSFRRKFFLLSTDAEAAEKAGISVGLWDFLFYVSLGLVITSCVTVAGVLLVFSYLVVPAVIAVMFADRTRVRIAIAWGVGTLVSVFGTLLSYSGDFPTGPSIVAGFTAAMIVAGLFHYVMSHEHSGVAAKRLVVGGAIAAVALGGTTFLRKGPEEHGHADLDPFSRLVAGLRSDNETSQLEAIHHLGDGGDKHAIPPIMSLLRKTPSDRVIEHAAEALARLDAAEAVPLLKEVAGRDLDADLRVTIARAILDLRDPSGFPILIDVLERESARVPREEAEQLIERRTGLRLDFSPGQERVSLGRLRQWWTVRGASLKWRGQAKRFE